MDFVLRTGDQAIWDPVFGVATVVAPPGIITGSSRAKNDGAVVCVQGDEGTVVVTATYTTTTHNTPGNGVLTIMSMGSDQIATRNTSDKRPVLLRGSLFRARLQVVAPATKSGVPDETLVYLGTGRFITANAKMKAM